MGRKLLGILLIAIIALLLAFIGPWSAKKRSAQMKTSIENSLSANGVEGVAVDMSGNVANLTGTVGSEDLIAKAKEIATGTECETCKKKGKIWHEVTSDLKVKEAPVVVQAAPAVPVQSPYTFSAVKGADGFVNLDGYVRNAAERERVTREAQSLFGDNLRSVDLKIASGAPNDKWGDIISKYLQEIRGLSSGTFLLNDAQSLITGEAPLPEIRERINGLAEKAGLGYNEATTLTVPNQASANVGSVNSQAVCQKLFDEIKGDAKINFRSAKADILGQDSLNLLGRLGEAMGQCSTFNVTVEGHTDSDGQEVYNQWLSEERAKAVRNDLIGRGIDGTRITAVGLGEALPKAGNDTPAGKAANRRIEFKITTSD